MSEINPAVEDIEISQCDVTTDSGSSSNYIPLSKTNCISVIKENGRRYDIGIHQILIMYFLHQPPDYRGCSNSQHDSQRFVITIQVVKTTQDLSITIFCSRLITVIDISEKIPKWLFSIYLSKNCGHLTAKATETVNYNIFHLVYSQLCPLKASIVACPSCEIPSLTRIFLIVMNTILRSSVNEQ